MNLTTRLAHSQTIRLARENTAKRKPSRKSNESGSHARHTLRLTVARAGSVCVRVGARSAMDFFKSVSARVGDVAKNVGDLLLDSDSESEADERSERTRRGGDDADRGEGSGPGGRRSRAGDGVAERGAGGASDSEGSEEDDGPLISEDVWNTLRAAKDRVAQAAKSTVASVSRDVAAAAETVRRDLGDLSNVPGESTNERPVVFVGDAASEYAAGGAGGLGVSVESDDDDDAGSDGDGSLDPDVAETFERTAEALENVGEKVERFGAAVFQNAGRLFDKIVDTFEEEDETDRGEGAAAPPGSYGVRATPKLVDTTKLVSLDSSSSLRRRSPNTAAETPDSVFDKKVATMQRDSSTYCDEPLESEAFATFAKTFNASSDDVKKKIHALLSTNSFMKTMSGRIVPAVVEHDVFWSRYFFRLRTLERERDGWEEPLAKTLLEPSGVKERPAGTAAGAGKKGGEENAPGANPDSTPFSDSPERTSPETKVVGEGASGEETGDDARVGEEEEEEKEEDEEEGTLPASGKTETDTLSTEIVHERVVVAGDETSDDGVASAPGHRRVVSLATDDGTVASDDSIGKDWTRVRDVDSPSSGRDEAVEADVRGAVHAAADEDEDDEKIDAGGSADSTKNSSASRTRPAESSLSEAKPPPEAKDTPGVLEDSDLDEDWGMDSD